MKIKRLLNWKLVLTTLLIVCLGIPWINIPKVSAWEKMEMYLPVISGNNVDARKIIYHDHVLAEGFGATVSAFFPVGRSEYTQTKTAFAVAGLGDSWLEDHIISQEVFTPYVKEMRLKVSGLYTATIDPEMIFTNTGTGSPSFVFLGTVLDYLGYAFLAYDIYSLLKEVFQTPPLSEWTPGGGHWQQAVVRQQQGPLPWQVIGENRLQTAGATVQSKFDVHGDTTLTILSEADMWVQCISNNIFGDVTVWHEKVGTYSVTFQVSPCVNLPPNNPDHPEAAAPLPSDPPGTGYRGLTYTFYAGTTDPEGDNIYYEFDWNDGSPITRIGPFASGSRPSATHSWSTLRTYYVKVRALDTFSFPSDWSVSYQLNIVDRPPNSPGPPQGPNSGYTFGTYYYFTSGATDPDGYSIYYEFNWGDGHTSTYGPIPSGSSLGSVPHSWSSAGTYSVTVRAKDVDGLFSAPSSPLTVIIINPPPSGGGGGGCPYVSPWNGTGYVLDNNLLPTSRLGNGSDVEDYYVLEKPLVENNGMYSLLISEFECEHDYLDQVKLIAVDHDSDVNIAVTPDGKILTYRNPASPISCVDSNGMDRLSEIRYIDGDFSDPSTYFQGNKNDYMLLNFGQVKPGPAKLIVRNDQMCADKCILVQVRNATGEWDTIAVIASRATWATEGVDLSAYVVRGEDLVVRLFWTQPHKLDFVGLDTTHQEDYEIHNAALMSATHSVQGNVRALISRNDDAHAELVPGQYIELQFRLPDNEEQERTFILFVEGHYDTIP